MTSRVVKNEINLLSIGDRTMWQTMPVLRTDLVTVCAAHRYNQPSAFISGQDSTVHSESRLGIR